MPAQGKVSFFSGSQGDRTEGHSVWGQAKGCAAGLTLLGLPSTEFFELISKAQSSRADDQRGLLRKEDLVLPAFLRLPPGATEHPGGSPTSSPSSADSDSLPAASKPPGGQGGAGGALEGAPEADLTLTGEGDISSPNSSLLPPPPTPQDAGPPTPGTSAF